MLGKKIFDKNGDLILRFSKKDTAGIKKWLGIDYKESMKFAKNVDCPVFGKALEFPCKWINY